MSTSVVGISSTHPITQILSFFLFLQVIMSSTETNENINKRKITSSSSSSNNDEPQNLPPHLHKRGKIILLGDSITQMSFSATLSGWGSYIADIYQRRCDVYNRGMSGYNTNWFLRYLESDVGHYDVFGSMMTAAQKDGNGGSISNSNSVSSSNLTTVGEVKLVTIFFGANDASSSTLNPRHHVPLPQFEANLKTIIQKCYQNFGSDTHIILITPPPVCHASRLEYQIVRYKEKATGKLERTLELSGDYAQAVCKVGNEMDVPCLNIWEMMQDSSQYLPGVNTLKDDKNTNNSAAHKKHPWSIYLSDGLHLSKEGNFFVGDNLVKLIQEKYPDIAVTPGPYTPDYTGNSSSKGGTGLGSDGGIGPWHDEINHLDVDDIFTKQSSVHTAEDGRKKLKMNREL